MKYLLLTGLIYLSISGLRAEDEDSLEQISFSEIQNLCFSSFSKDLSIGRENELIAHVKNSISLAEQGLSKLDTEVLNLQGLSSAKVRHFLNNLCTLPGTSYFEVGAWKGSTWVSSLYKNQDSITLASAADNWPEFTGAEEAFLTNCSTYLSEYDNYRIYSGNPFQINTAKSFELPVNIYFYDGNHSTLSQELAFTYFNDIFDDVFIAVVDDWNWKEVQNGTHSAFDKLKYQILFELDLPARHNQDAENWWNGLYVAVIQKSPGK